MLHELLHTLKESLILLPFLFVCYSIIELVETWTSKKTTRSLKGNGLQVLIGASIGLIPQCGFGVVATDMYAKKKIRMGTLIAIYIATSDEAIPVILSHPDKIGALLPLLITKFLFALLAGYIVYVIELKLEKKSNQVHSINATNNTIITLEHEHEHDDIHGNNLTHDHDEQTIIDEDTIHIGCCGHEIEENENGKTSTKAKLKRYLLHPLLHTLYIFAFILVINLAFSALVYSVGENNLAAFMTGAKALTPLFAVIIGLIPNCAASVVLTNMYLLGSLPFGSMIAGLIVNAGIAITVLFKQNKNQKQNFTILGVCILTALVAGYALLFII